MDTYTAVKNAYLCYASNTNVDPQIGNGIGCSTVHHKEHSLRKEPKPGNCNDKNAL